MPLREPAWWYGAGPSWQAALLSPVAKIVGRIASSRLRSSSGYRAQLPVLCVGNFTAGGSGKTPFALLLARLVAEENLAPWFLSRGYGGRAGASQAVVVNRSIHGADDVGDEPLLLAAHAPAVVSRDRRQGAELIERNAGPSAAIIMDDGMQNPALIKDFTIAVVDCARGFGNNRVIPAGPLRAPLASQISVANLIVLNGEARNTPVAENLRRTLGNLTNAPVISASVRPAGDTKKFQGRKLIAYAGIANPSRFFALLETLGAAVLQSHTFADHHAFTESDAAMLIATARKDGAELVTTEKDYVRLAGATGTIADLREASSVLAIEATLDATDLLILQALIRNALAQRPRIASINPDETSRFQR